MMSCDLQQLASLREWTFLTKLYIPISNIFKILLFTISLHVKDLLHSESIATVSSGMGLFDVLLHQLEGGREGGGREGGGREGGREGGGREGGREGGVGEGENKGERL